MPSNMIRLGLLVDEKWYTDFFVKLGSLLAETGQVAPTLFMCRESALDPEASIPFVRFHEESGESPRYEYDWHAITGYERFLAYKDDYFENRWDEVACSLTAQAENYFEENHFDCIVLWSGTRMNLRAVTAAARNCGVAVVTLETPYFQELPDLPETDFVMDLHRMKNKVLIWDTVQAPQCGPSQLSRDWKQGTLRLDLQAFFDRLHAERVSKYSQEDIKRFLSGKADAKVEASDLPDVDVELFKPPKTRVLLVLGQVSHDSARYFGKHSVDDWRELGLELAKRLPSNWIIWFKGHPMDRAYATGTEEFAWELHEINARSKVLPTTMDIHLCYQRCDAVACINSTSTIEAATYKIPVLNFGWGAFTEIGMSYKVNDLNEVTALLETLPVEMTPEQVAIRDHFLSYVLYDYLIPVGSPKKMISRIRQAIEEGKQSVFATSKAQDLFFESNSPRPGVPESTLPPDQSRLMVLSFPKSGTYLAAATLEALTLSPTHCHFSLDYVDVYDPAKLTLGRTAPENFRIHAPIEETLSMIRTGQFGVGHLPCTPHVISALEGFRLMLCIRDPRNILLSFMRFLYDTKRNNAVSEDWFKARDVAAFVRHRGAGILETIRTIAPWAAYSDVFCFSFTQSPEQLAQEVQKLARFLNLPDKVNSEAIAAQVLATPTLTRSSGDIALKWDDDAEAAFSEMQGLEIEEWIRDSIGGRF